MFPLKQEILYTNRSFPLSLVFLMTVVLSNVVSKVSCTCPFDSDINMSRFNWRDLTHPFVVKAKLFHTNSMIITFSVPGLQ